MLTDAELVAFVPTADLDRAQAFYTGALGLALLEQTPFAAVFKAPNAVLRATLVTEPAEAAYTVLGWTVSNIAAAAGQLRERGLEPLRYDGMDQDALGIWRAPSGAQVLWFKDPDGNVLSLTEL
jgi:catechol 2,3-dioxygenase-like lactoylglutathione lyase family enzyme